MSLRTFIFKTLLSAIGLVSFSAVSFFVAVFIVGVTYFSIKERLIVFETVYSPDGKLKAVVYGGGHIPDYKNVSVLNAEAKLEKDQSGNVFFESCDRASAKWIDNQRLVIYRDGDGHAHRKSLNFIAFDRAVDVAYRDLKSK